MRVEQLRPSRAFCAAGSSATALVIGMLQPDQCANGAQRLDFLDGIPQGTRSSTTRPNIARERGGAVDIRVTLPFALNVDGSRESPPWIA